MRQEEWFCLGCLGFLFVQNKKKEEKRKKKNNKKKKKKNNPACGGCLGGLCWGGGIGAQRKRRVRMTDAHDGMSQSMLAWGHNQTSVLAAD